MKQPVPEAIDARIISETIAPQERPAPLPVKVTATGVQVYTVAEARRMMAFSDGYVNVANNMGRLGKDSVASTAFQYEVPLDYATLQQIYRHDGLGRRLVEIPVREMTRRGFTVTGDNDGEVVKYLRQRGFMKQMPFVLRWAWLYGGAIGVILADDGCKDLSMPLRENQLKSLRGMNVFDRWRCTFTTADMYLDPTHPKYMWPRRYYVQPMGFGSPFYVHESRVIRIDGAPIPEIDRQGNNYWMDSKIQSVAKSLRSLMASYGYTESIIADFVQGVFSMEGLSQLIAAGKDDEVMRKMQIIRLFKGNTNVFPIDKDGEKYEKVVSSTTGLEKLIDQMWALLSGATGWPQIVWQGRSPTGLNASGDSEMQMFYDNMHEDQVDNLASPWHRLATLAYKCKDGPTGGVLPADAFDIEFPPLYQPTDKESAEIESKQTETDAKRIAAKIISPAVAPASSG